MPPSKDEQVRIEALDLAMLLYHVFEGARHPAVGFEDCERTLGQLKEELAPKRFVVPLSAIESALWSANLMDELGLWRPLNEEPFERFARRVLRYVAPERKLEFDRKYNLLKETK